MTNARMGGYVMIPCRLCGLPSRSLLKDDTCSDLNSCELRCEANELEAAFANLRAQLEAVTKERDSWRKAHADALELIKKQMISALENNELTALRAVRDAAEAFVKRSK